MFIFSQISLSCIMFNCIFLYKDKQVTDLWIFTILNILLPVEKPIWNLILSRVWCDCNNFFNLQINKQLTHNQLIIYLSLVLVILSSTVSTLIVPILNKEWCRLGLACLWFLLLKLKIYASLWNLKLSN